MLLGTLTVVSIASTPGKGGTRTLRRTEGAGEREFPVATGASIDPPLSLSAAGKGGARAVLIRRGCWTGDGSAREGRRGFKACFAKLSLAEESCGENRIKRK